MATNDKTDSASLLQQALEAEQKKNQQLADANTALVQEFSDADSYSEQLDIAKKAIKKILPKAIETVNEILISGESEGVRANLAKYVLDSVLTGKLDRDADGEVAGLLKKLTEAGEADNLVKAAQDGQ